MALRGPTLDEALRAVLEPVGGTFHREGRIVTVSTGSGSPHTTEPTSAEKITLAPSASIRSIFDRFAVDDAARVTEWPCRRSH